MSSTQEAGDIFGEGSGPGTFAKRMKMEAQNHARGHSHVLLHSFYKL